ncbi:MULTISPECIES: ABC transporter ATP-binding protein [Gordonia]|uniref:ABC transporter ATP-binding protein n=2 Tax=Gordonia TaxID=2053 RepID=A0ABP5V0A8_9ACTN|nr:MULTISPECIES: ABC transporter ATP-binding protein [Gordonia]AUH67418.1 ABC transporter ATP-binding protein [Gordonia sp. YC-JH1]KJR07793.1 ABC transporter ATP-binding protein [Gordonia sihwensis]KXT56129.1 ABC transporter ATP-binding protein [Gordonia sp. QH-12]MBY4570485.1 ABC transporter ATP-binding protein [Gordonia sihwensis]WFN92938.1 ABC transporter ATP-binding protein [Gordonia sihwensis]
MSLDLRDVRVEYHSGEERLTVLDGFDATFRAGEATAIVGPSGSGKSTLLGVCGILRQPDSGSVTLDDTEVTGLSVRARDRMRRTRVGYVFQSGNLFPGLTVLDQVLAQAVISGRRPSQARDRALHLLDEVGLAGHEKQRPDELSGGQRQRVAIARALVHEPRLLLIDEPTAAVDRSQAGRITALIKQVTAESGCITVIATHDPEVMAAADSTLSLAAV